MLDARLDLNPEEQTLLNKYETQLFDLVLYDSDARVQHEHSAQERYQAAAESAEAVPLFPDINDIPSAIGNFFSSLWNLGAGATHDVISTLSLQLTLRSLLAGLHVESESMHEILYIAGKMKLAAEDLSEVFHLALTFDGSEDLSEH